MSYNIRKCKYKILLSAHVYKLSTQIWLILRPIKRWRKWSIQILGELLQQVVQHLNANVFFYIDKNAWKIFNLLHLFNDCKNNIYFFYFRSLSMRGRTNFMASDVLPLWHHSIILFPYKSRISNSHVWQQRKTRSGSIFAPFPFI